jgi:hypothetical protein
MKINKQKLAEIIKEEYADLVREGWIPDEFGHLGPERKPKKPRQVYVSVKPTATFKGQTVTYPSGDYEGLMVALTAVNNGVRPTVEDIKNNLQISDNEKRNLINHAQSSERFLKNHELQ